MTPDHGATEAPRTSPHASSGELETILPRDLAGDPYQVQGFTIDVRDDLGGGDVCSFFCPGELGGFARELGVESGPITVAMSYPQVSDPAGSVLIRAIRVPGAENDRLIEAWAHRYGTEPRPPFPIIEPLTIAGKLVALIWMSPLAVPFDTTYAYAHDGVLFLAYGVPEPADLTRPGPLVVAAFDALP